MPCVSHGGVMFLQSSAEDYIMRETSVLIPTARSPKTFPINF